MPWFNGTTGSETYILRLYTAGVSSLSKVITIEELSPSISSYFLEDIDILFVPLW